MKLQLPQKRHGLIRLNRYQNRQKYAKISKILGRIPYCFEVIRKYPYCSEVIRKYSYCPEVIRKYPCYTVQQQEFLEMRKQIKLNV